MTNLYIPFPRNENIIIVGDTATEILSALRIFGRGLVGGEVPSMELLHPNEKPLECISCFLNNPHLIVEPAVRKINADYVLLEKNGIEGFDPSVAQEQLVKAGICVKILDVIGSTDEVLIRAGDMFGEQRQAKRVIDQRAQAFQELNKRSIPKGLRAVVLLGIRNVLRHESYVFRVAAHSQLSRLMFDYFGLINVFNSPPEDDHIEGIQDLGDLSELMRLNPDLVVLTGDATACSKAVTSTILRHPELKNLDAVQNARIVALPYYCKPLDWRSPMILESWADALTL